MAYTSTELATAMGVRQMGEEHLKWLAPVDNRGGWTPWIREPFSGAWQRNEEWTVDTVVAYPTVYSCLNLISNDIGKLPHILLEQDGNIWVPTENPAYSPVLRKPNRYQNHIQFKQWWIMSKLMRGNTYALKVRDNRGVVTALYLLDPCRVQVLVATDGSIFYQLSEDNISGIREDSITVPASEIIHDRMNCMFHPLVGISPLFAAGVVANIGLKVEGNVLSFFGNNSNPGGVLIAPGAISDGTAARLKEYWEENYGGRKNSGKVAVLGDNLKYEPMRMTASDSQLVELLKWTDEKICSVFQVPAYKVGVGDPPSYNNIEAQDQNYYSQCLQIHIEQYELCMDEGLNLPKNIGIELDLKSLIRMDTSAQVSTLQQEISAGTATINEAREIRGRKPVEGGNSIWKQQQDTSLAALAERDRNSTLTQPVQQTLPLATDEVEEVPDDSVERFMTALTKSLEAA